MYLQANAALIAIDVQRGFDTVDPELRNNPEMEENGKALIGAWRPRGGPLVHTRHDSLLPQSPLRPGQPGNGFKPGFEPRAGELVVPKTVNSAFIGTDLEAWLRHAGIRQLILFGIATDMCVSTTARMGANLGFEVIIAGDACHTWSQLAPNGEMLAADLMHQAHLATLATEFGRVATTSELLEEAAMRLAS